MLLAGPDGDVARLAVPSDENGIHGFEATGAVRGYSVVEIVQASLLGIARILPAASREPKNPRISGGFLVGDTGIEPVTSSVSGKRATAAPIARPRRTLASSQVSE